MHPDFVPLIDSWNLTLEADGYAQGSRTSYNIALTHLLTFLADNHPDVGPQELRRDHIRAWVVHLRQTVAQNSARSWFGGGVRHFCRWMVEEGEVPTDVTAGIKTPKASDPYTPVLTQEQMAGMLATCSGTGFGPRRDAAILYVFFDSGLRLAELTDLKVSDFDLRARMLFVEGKGTNLSGPRRRAAPVGLKATRALDRYLRERRKHPLHELPGLWLGQRNRGVLGKAAIIKIVKDRAKQAGITGYHPHVSRHTWASEYRKAGGEEGNLMVLGGWRNRQILDRYGKAAAADRALGDYRSRSLGDRL